MIRRYLVVDDNEAFAENLGEILRDGGAEVDVCHNAAQAIARVRSQRYDALVSDMRMPGMNGAELLQVLRQIDPGLPVVLLSAFAFAEQLVTARRHGVLGVLSKPHQIPQLLRLLALARRDAAVLVVEDDMALADNLSEALSERGLSTMMVNDVKDLGRVSTIPFAILVDLKMPDAAFGESLQRVKTQWPTARTLAMTAFAKDAIGPLTDVVFHKPFDTNQVLEHLETLYQQSTAS
jgi:CheY-like chemotaxis protein